MERILEGFLLFLNSSFYSFFFVVAVVLFKQFLLLKLSLKISKALFRILLSRRDL